MIWKATAAETPEPLSLHPSEVAVAVLALVLVVAVVGAVVYGVVSLLRRRSRPSRS